VLETSAGGKQKKVGKSRRQGTENVEREIKSWSHGVLQLGGG